MSSAYRLVIRTLDRHVPAKYEAVWNHPAGPKTVHFWAPLWKWALVIAGLSFTAACLVSFGDIKATNVFQKGDMPGIGDATRPPDKISMPQSTALAATGIIWARYSLVIIPKNWSLFAVNVFVGITGISQLTRAYFYQKSLKAKEAQVEGGAEVESSAK